jgi:hypothetical protein
LRVRAQIIYVNTVNKPVELLTCYAHLVLITAGQMKLVLFQILSKEYIPIGIPIDDPYFVRTPVEEHIKITAHWVQL